MAVLNYYHLGQTIPEGMVYIGRGHAGRGLPHSPWHNPFVLKKGDDREEIAQQYKEYLLDQLQQGKLKVDDLMALKDKDLVCFCAPKTCHGHVLEEVIQCIHEGRLVFDPTPPQPSGRWKRSQP